MQILLLIAKVVGILILGPFSLLCVSVAFRLPDIFESLRDNEFLWVAGAAILFYVALTCMWITFQLLISINL
jgi:hypothetical protein